ncbi:MAG TPA: bifunctional diaminohydroxyphosphoribosylaminopyrimidine deaminase/5-amino-6-(5-phosphoribosylamino)uracil reductase RibD [Caulobacteraceae bacterium]|jgi:diaminohydroxyphosphoribosylaminopyrimidine deaminase/5-amino-6-(5-phosphoribosylamino)uracil reductase|nr:bifunctional diaminohydroxyphosphoribosylaminopyrimidine deaminase/5-amino-6-(5-phosphoribosylamino)uracil reductase RibD [Caulobacteraceae bacterium]
MNATDASRPRVTLKLATSLDGRIATASGESKWITGEEARAKVHELRAQHDAVLVGIKTVMADDPSLTVRTPGYDGPQPLRVVLDSKQRLPASSALAANANDVATLVLTVDEPRGTLEKLGVRVVRTQAAAARVDIEDALRKLKAQSVESVLVEGGGEVAAAFLRAALVDAIEWFRAPLVLGSEGRPAIGSLVLDKLSQAPRFQRTLVEPLGADLRERYEKA